jgi:hypothetical protein
MPEPTVPQSFLDLVSRLRGQAGQSFMDLLSRIPGAAQSRATRDPMLFLRGAQMPGYHGLTGFGASVIGPEVTEPLQAARPGQMQGTARHEVIHQILGGTKVPPAEFLKALPPDISELMRAALTKNFATDKWGEEIPAHLGSSFDVPGSAYGTNQAYDLGLEPAQAQQAWNTYLSLLAKQDPSKAAKLLRFANPSALAEQSKQSTPAKAVNQ